jgi:transposase
MDRLAALVKEQLQIDPFSGVIFCFRAKRADRVIPTAGCSDSLTIHF